MRTKGIVPIDLKDTEPWTGSICYSPGAHGWKVTGWDVGKAKSTGKKVLQVEHKCLRGDGDVGKTFTRNFALEGDKVKESLNFIRGYVDAVATANGNKKLLGPTAAKPKALLIYGERLVGCTFDADLVVSEYEDPRTKTLRPRFDFDLNTIAPLSAATGGDEAVGDEEAVLDEIPEDEIPE